MIQEQGQLLQFPDTRRANSNNLFDIKAKHTINEVKHTKYKASVFVRVCFKLKIPSEMEVEPCYTLFTLLALFILFKLLYTAQTIQ